MTDLKIHLANFHGENADLNCQKKTSRSKPKPKIERNCQVCGKMFFRPEHLKRHIAHVHEKEKVKEINCEFCFIPFTRKDHLSRHIKRLHKSK